LLKIIILVLLLIFQIFIPRQIGNKVDDRLKQFLNKIKMIESSGGKDLDHKEMTSGIHEGQSAYGSYGLMPNTIQEILNRKRLNEKKLPQDLKNIYQQDPEFVKTVLSARPDLEEQLASELAKRLLNKTQGDEEKAAYGWNMGHNIPVEKITPEKLDNHEYIKRFRSLREKVGAR